MKLAASLVFTLGAAIPAMAGSIVFFSTGDVTNSVAVATRPESGGKFEIEAGDDFTLGTTTRITSASFTGLLTGGATAGDISKVVVEIYRVFPDDSDVGRTSGPPTFSTPQVPTRVNSPSDVAFDIRASDASGLTFATSTLDADFTALNSIQPGGIHPLPNQTTGGDGAVNGAEVQINTTFVNPFTLPAGHYFFVPQVGVSLPNGDFLWLSGTRPIVPPGTPFAPDLQSWTRDANLDPDWLRVGTDILGAGTFNQAFSFNGSTVPEPGTLLPVGLVLAAAGLARLRRK